MKIGLIDVDGHNFPNLALMRIAAYHKVQGDSVEWWQGFDHYDVVYMSKVYSDAYSPDVDEPLNADKIIKGGTGYCISLDENGREVFDESLNVCLPREIERMPPDYSIYPQYDFAVAMTSRGCPRDCPFCHVTQKEGRASVKVADITDFWTGQKEIKVLDPNITACRDKRILFNQYRESGAWVDFTQGIDLRLINDADIDDLNHTKIKALHFAWDNPGDDLADKLAWFADAWKIKDCRRKTVYVLTNFENCSVTEHIDRALARIYKLCELGYTPYLMVYNKPNAPKEIIRLQGWCNNKRIIKVRTNFFKYYKERYNYDMQENR